MRFIKHNALFDICINNIQRYITSSIDFIVAVNDLVRFRINNIS